MQSPPRPTSANTTPPFVQPYLHALNRMQARQAPQPAHLTRRARALLDARFGTSAHAAEAAFAHGPLGLMSEHTHYFEGFALLRPLPFGTAVAIRAYDGPDSRIAFEGEEQTWTFDRSATARPPGTPLWACVIEDIVLHLAPGRQQVEIGVVGTVPAFCMETYLSALGMAAARALQALFALSVPTPLLLRTVAERVAACADVPFGITYPIAADTNRLDAFTLVDATTLEYLLLDAPSAEQLGWGIINLPSASPPPTFYQKRQHQADQALDTLQRKGFAHLTSFRDLEHQDLHRALGVLPRALRPIVRYLVGENRRVQRLVLALRNHDWQMLGALLLMSHASKREDWDHTNAQADFVVEQVEAMSMEGMYGATSIGPGGCVLVVGQPFVVPLCLDRVRAAVEARFGEAPETMLL